MGMNRFSVQILLSAVLAAPSYAFLYLIRGLDWAEWRLYAHGTYAGVVFVILLCLFVAHTAKSRRLDRNWTWKRDFSKRLAAEGLTTLVLTPVVVSLGMVLLYQVFWDMELWIPGLIEYNLFALVISALIAVFVNADVLVDDWKRSLVRAEAMEKEAIQAQFSALQLQLSPHFLFNHFNVLHALIADNPSLAGRYLETMSDVFRYILKRKDEEVVPLEEELAFVQNYLFLLKIRYGDRVQCVVDVKDAMAANIPPATLQILIENAIMHNEISSDHPLSICIRTPGRSILEVSNSLQPKAVSRKGAGVGLKNIMERYRYLTDRKVDVVQSDSRFIVQVPLLEFRS